MLPGNSWPSVFLHRILSAGRCTYQTAAACVSVPLGHGHVPVPTIFFPWSLPPQSHAFFFCSWASLLLRGAHKHLALRQNVFDEGRSGVVVLYRGLVVSHFVCVRACVRVRVCVSWYGCASCCVRE